MSKIKKVIFVDSEKTAVKIFRDEGLIEVRTYDVNDEELKEFTEYDIEKETINFLNEEAEAIQGYKRYLEGASILGDAKSIVTREYTSDDLFELKLSAFELEHIRKSKDRKMKVQLRKSKDIFELFHNIYLMREGEPEPEVEEDTTPAKARKPKKASPIQSKK